MTPGPRQCLPPATVIGVVRCDCVSGMMVGRAAFRGPRRRDLARGREDPPGPPLRPSRRGGPGPEAPLPGLPEAHDGASRRPRGEAPSSPSPSPTLRPSRRGVQGPGPEGGSRPGPGSPWSAGLRGVPRGGLGGPPW